MGTGAGAGTETRAVAGKGTGTRTGSGTGKETKLEREEGGEESSGIRHIGKEAEYNTRHCYSARGIISVDRRWHLQVASSFGRYNRRRPVDGVPRGEQGTRDGREETVMGTGTGAGTGGNTRTGMSTRVGMGAGTGAGTGERTGTRVEMRVGGRESPGTYEVVIEVGFKTREGGRRD